MKDKEDNINKNKFRNVGGIDISRVINKDYLLSWGDFYKCIICSKIMINPTDCENCGHSFCNECISISKCPYGCEKKAFKSASMGIKNLLNNLKFKCFNEGCEEIISYSDVKAHDNNCPFQKLACPNDGCSEQLLKKDLKNHIKNICKFTLKKCPYCNYKFPRHQISEHKKMCSMAYQSFKKNNENINTNDNKQIDKNKSDSKYYNREISDNYNKKPEDNKKLNENKDNNINNEIINRINNINNHINNINNNVNNIISSKNNINNNIFNSNNLISNKNNKLLSENDNKQNENIENNNESSRLSLRQSMAQIEEDDLIDILKKAIEEKLNERFVNFDTNYDQLIKDIKIIKTFACKTEPMEEVKENEEDEKNEERNKSKKKNINQKIVEKEIKLNKIKEYLKVIINKAEKEINLGINHIKEQITNVIDTNKNKIKNISNDYNNEVIINEISKIVDAITKKIIENISEWNKKINNINLKMENDLDKIIPKNLVKNKENNINEKIISNLENIIKKVIENSIKEYINKLFNKIEEKINYIPKNMKVKEEKESEIKNNEIRNKNLNDKFISMNKDLNIVNKELKIIESNIKEITNKFSEQCIEIMNLTSKNNINNEIMINNNINNNEGKNIKKVLNHNINNFSFGDVDKRKNSPSKYRKAYSDNINFKSLSINENLIKKNRTNNKIGRNINISNNELSLDSTPKNHKNENKYLSNKMKEQVINNLSELISKISLVNTFSKEIPDLIKDKLTRNLENIILNLNKKIENDLNEKINKMFQLKYCIECDKVDYLYGFMKCSNCLKDNCKQCISICISCKLFVCKKCCICPKCRKLYCLKCRYSCEQCKNKFCKYCLFNCNICSKYFCSKCLKGCTICQNLHCYICGNNCYICNQNLCNKCNSFKNGELFTKCTTCNKVICGECSIECETCNEKICKNCFFHCKKCNKRICFYCLKACGFCFKNFCKECSSDFEKMKCEFCNKILCNNCISNIIKCEKCKKKVCKDCFIQCFQCKSYNCKKCIKKCSNCNNKICIKCQNKCLCGLVIFCGDCLLSNKEVSPHECTQFINGKSNFNIGKAISTIKLNKSFEAKFLLEKKNIEGKTLIGISDIDENIFLNEIKGENYDILALEVGGGEIYSKKNHDIFLESEIKEKDFIYMMVKYDKLYFKINKGEYKFAFNLEKKDYYIYLENNNDKNCSNIKFIFIREIENI